MISPTALLILAPVSGRRALTLIEDAEKQWTTKLPFVQLQGTTMALWLNRKNHAHALPQSSLKI
jgi:hypothetical protein